MCLPLTGITALLYGQLSIISIVRAIKDIQRTHNSMVKHVAAKDTETIIAENVVIKNIKV